MRKAIGTNLRAKLTDQFPADLATLLVEFNKYIADLDADYIVLMARKVLRLYDFLLFTGGPTNQKPVLSDHVLEQSPQIFKGKRVCLVDDTLILGTTLGEAKKKLLDAGAKEVTCHVFAADEDNWCRDLITPEKIFTFANHAKIQTICALEIAALSSAGIPYLSDFPFSEVARLTSPKLALLHFLSGWDAYTLNAPARGLDENKLYTFLPRSETYETIRGLFGQAISDLLEITKVRAFCARAKGAYWTRFVPIVTLRPIENENVERLFDGVLRELEKQCPEKLARIRSHLTSPISRLRFIQYVLSLAVGNVFLREFSELSESRKPIRFDLGEAVRLFGPWLQSEIQAVHSVISHVFKPDAYISDFQDPAPVEAALPDKVIEVSKAEFKEFIRSPNGERQLAPSHFTDLVRAFVGLHRKYEPPARKEAHSLGKRVFSAPASEAPFRDRLKFGFVWRALAESLLEKSHIRATPRRLNLLSLMLDQLIDMGIAVPVLCQRNGILFRAYRYGEDVEFGDQEIALSYEIAKGYLESSHREGITKVVLEKLLVSLLRVGVSKKFLKIVTGQNGTEGIARIGFHLHGAVPMLPRNETMFADNQDTWLSRYLVDREALLRDKNNYRLGKRPDAAFPDVGAVTEAHQLGWLMGMLATSKATNGSILLDQSSMIVLTSCTLPRDAACAIGAELRLLGTWFDRHVRRLRSTNLSSEKGLDDAINQLVQGQGYIATNSARLKLSGYWANRPKEIVTSCAAYLADLPNGAFLSAHWRSDWEPVLDGNSLEQQTRFNPWINAAASSLLVLSLGVFTIELALLSALLAVTSSERAKRKVANACDKIASYTDSLARHCALSKREKQMLIHVADIVKNKKPMPSPQEALEYGFRWIDSRLSEVKALASHIEDAVRDFGRDERRTKFSYALWYDVIDSRGRKSKLGGEALKSYRERVRAFKHSINRDLYGLSRDAGRAGATAYPWQGPLNSKDDEKHIFFAGTRSLSWLQQAVRILLRCAEAHQVRVRVLAIPADFAVIAAHKYDTEPTVDGDAFWEHVATIKEELRKLESQTAQQMSGKPPQHSILWIAGALIDTLEVSELIFWSKTLHHQIRTDIDDLALTTNVKGGIVRWGVSR